MLLNLEVAEREAYQIIEKGFAEIVFRDENKRFDRMIKFAVENSDKIDSDKKDELLKQVKKMVQKQSYDVREVRNMLNKADKKMAVALDSLKDVAVNVDAIAESMKGIEALASINIGLQLVNIAVNVAGFVIIANKLNKLSAEVKEISDKLGHISDVQKNEKIETCQVLIMKFNAVTDKVKTKSNINLDELQNLVIEMRAFLSSMISNLNDEALGADVILQIINTLMPAYTLLVCEHLDRYHFANGTVPTNYGMFVSLFDEFFTKQFSEKLEDYYMFEVGLSQLATTDAVNAQILMALNAKTQVEDQLVILEELKTKENIMNYRASMEAAINEYISKIIPDLAESTGLDEQTCREVLLTN